VVFGIITVFELGTCAASVCSTFGSRPLVFAPPMNSVGIPIDSASDLENPGRSSRTCPIRVVALSIKGCFISGGSRCQRPGPSMTSSTCCAIE
jgi:hypothetical protein